MFAFDQIAEDLDDAAVCAGSAPRVFSEGKASVAQEIIDEFQKANAQEKKEMAQIFAATMFNKAVW